MSEPLASFTHSPDLFVIHGQELYYTAVQCRREGYVWLGKLSECMSALAGIFMSSYFGYSVTAERRRKLIAGWSRQSAISCKTCHQKRLD